MKPWERYADLVEDAEAFRRACQRPLPSVVRVNPIKANPERVRTALSEENVPVTPREWNERTLELDTERPGLTWPYQHGWIHGQEEISQLPATLLELSGEERIWDAAAAPGGKATQLAAMVRAGGMVVANDVNLGRLSALRTNADRLGADNLVVTNQNARTYSLEPFGFESFDAALVDAPCTGEGTVRKNPGVIDEWSKSGMDSLVEVQRDVLQRAVEVTRPEGHVVYSTCTFAPEENEGVLSAVLESASCSMEPFSHSLHHAEGVTEWNGTEYDSMVRHAKRFYPHHNDTGGFFCAKLRVEA